jgi:hypothetical protein
MTSAPRSLREVTTDELTKTLGAGYKQVSMPGEAGRDFEGGPCSSRQPAKLLYPPVAVVDRADGRLGDAFGVQVIEAEDGEAHMRCWQGIADGCEIPAPSHR